MFHCLIVLGFSNCVLRVLVGLCVCGGLVCWVDVCFGVLFFWSGVRAVYVSGNRFVEEAVCYSRFT